MGLPSAIVVTSILDHCEEVQDRASHLREGRGQFCHRKRRRSCRRLGPCGLAFAFSSAAFASHLVDALTAGGDGEFFAVAKTLDLKDQRDVLAPIQALRELGDDQYAVFVVRQGGDQDGELEMRLVQVGLRDYVNAEILSGLQRGEVVSTGEKTTTDSNTNSSSQPNQPPPGGIMRFMGG